MGREFFYCSICNSRLSSDDFNTAKAFEIRGQFSCENCIEALIAPLSFKEQEQILLDIKEVRQAPRVAIARPPSSTAQPAAPRARVPSGPHRAAALGPRPSAARQKSSANPYSLAFLIGTLVLALVLAGLYHFGGSSRPDPPPAPPTAGPPSKPTTPQTPKPLPPKPSQPKPPAPAKSPAELAVEAARKFAQDNPEDFAGQIERYQKAIEAGKGTSAEDLMRKELKLVQEGHTRTIVMALLALDEELKAARAKEEFKKALDRLEEVRPRFGVSAWANAIDLRVRDFNRDIWNVFTPLRNKALAAKQAGSDPTVQAISERVKKWGVDSFSSELAKSLNPPENLPAGTAKTGAQPTVAPPPPVAPPAGAQPEKLTNEGKAYQTQWQAAMKLASFRNYAGAVKLLEDASKKLTETATVAESRVDAREIRRLAEFQNDVLGTLTKWPRGEQISVVFIDEEGDSIQIDGPMVAADGEGVEVMVKGQPVFLEMDDLTARSLTKAHGTRKAGKPTEQDRLTSAYFCLLEGDPTGARMVLAGPTHQIPWKYWALAGKLEEARSPSTPAGKRALEARKLYFGAEREFASVRTRGAAIEKYRALLNKYADAPVVRRKRERIVARREKANDYIWLSDDLSGSGTFKATSHEEAGPCWSSDSDSPPSRGRENFVQFSFYALPDTEYKAWVYVGGCCKETFQFAMQGTDVTYTHPRTREIIDVKPDGNESLPVKHSIPFLKSRHDIHGGPKQTSRWDWVELDLPNYVTAGIKTLRVLTEQKGFSVAWAAVSATRKTPPGEASEMKQLVRERTATAPAAAGTPVEAPATERDPTLVGLWRLDVAGATALDSSGHDNTGILVSEPRRAEGKLGTGISLDGGAKHISIPNSPSLEEVQEGSYTIAAWFMPQGRPEGEGSFAVMMKGERGEGIRYTSEGRFVMDHRLKSEVAASASTRSTYPPGRFHHVAGVVSRKEGSTRIYVNGRLESSEKWKPNSSTREFGAEIWKIGLSGTTLWPANGVVDDVRIYRRALSANDIRILAGMGSGRIPVIELTKPTTGQKFAVKADILIDLDVTDEDNRISRIEFYQGSKLLHTDKRSPYFYSWQGVSAGMHTIRVRAVDRSGAEYWAGPVNVGVGQVKLYRAINLGGESVTVDGVSWEPGEAPNVSCNGETLPGKNIALDPEIDSYRSLVVQPAVWHPKGTQVSVDQVPEGLYQVYLYARGEGDKETYDISMNGKTVENRYTCGPTGSWNKLGPWDVTVKDGSIHLSARGGRANFCGVEIWKIYR